MTTRAFVFPGQGSQVVGMAAALAANSPAAREVLAEVDDALGQRLSRLMADGPPDALMLTENAQPAIMASSMAVLRTLEREAGFVMADHVQAVAGHSLGEYSALCAAGAIGLADTARLLRARGAAMQAAVPVGVGAMAAILGATLGEVVAIASASAVGEVCDVANDNAPGQVVISGTAAAVARAVEAAKAIGKKAMTLPVSAPFHCQLMQPAADAMATVLAAANILPPFLPVYANVTAAPAAQPGTIRTQLVAQITGRVRWQESIMAMVDHGIDSFVEIGTGKILSGMIRRIHKDAGVRTVETMADIDAFIATL